MPTIRFEEESGRETLRGYSTTICEDQCVERSDRACEDVMADKDKVTEEMGECGDPVLSRIGNFGRYQARVSG